ncbi:DUF2946 domain-containing protein [Dyella sp.]|uniref:DUF2946 domain-containing protein n=1 Tax=Dyella sp. TaxID=1869338 RepID=UPI002D76620A|nr:DUF2946 domain-containing protein [Dyella sp.]HET6431015.1 DUF2946 domain-containing protein [Dyella sp.]
MSTARRPRRLTAWLAIVALWLTIAAPVVSQTLASPLDALVSIGWCGTHHDDGTPSPPAGHLLEKCGYCGLLSGHSLLPDAPPSLASGLPLSGLWLAMPAPPARSRIVLLAARPRGPPVPVHV